MATAKYAINLAFVNLAFAIQKTLDNIQKKSKTCIRRYKLKTNLIKFNLIKF